jgi:hypothetical protein
MKKNWWDAAPLATKNTDANWWDAAPLADAAPKPTVGTGSTTQPTQGQGMGLINGTMKAAPDVQANATKLADDRRAQRAAEMKALREQVTVDMAAFKAEMRKPLKGRDKGIISLD